MTYVITEPCVDLKDKSCVEVCPVDCIIGTDEDRMLYIDPDECIDCGACVDPCPVDAIFAEQDVPSDQAAYTNINRLYFEDRDAARSRVDELRPRGGSDVSDAQGVASSPAAMTAADPSSPEATR